MMKRFLGFLLAGLLGQSVALAAFGPGSGTNRLYLQYTSAADANWVELAADNSSAEFRLSSRLAGASKPELPLVLSAGSIGPDIYINTNHFVGFGTNDPKSRVHIHGHLRVASNALVSGTVVSGSNITTGGAVFNGGIAVPGFDAAATYSWVCTNAATGEAHWADVSGGGGSGSTNNVWFTSTNATESSVVIDAPTGQLTNILSVVSTNGNYVLVVTPLGVMSGHGGYIDKAGQFVLANGYLVEEGDVQGSFIPMFVQTTDGATNTLFLDGVSAVCGIRDDTSWVYHVHVVARDTGGTDDAGYEFRGVIRRNSGTVTIDQYNKIVLHESDVSWDSNVVEDDTGKALKIEVVGAAATIINWSAVVQLVEVKG